MSSPRSPFCVRLVVLVGIALLVSIPSQFRQVDDVTKKFNSASSWGVLRYKVTDTGQWERPFNLENTTNISSQVHSHFMNPPGIIVMNRYKSSIHSHGYFSNSITLVSQMSIDKKRIQRHLLDLVSRWSGYISLAIYVPPASANGGGLSAQSNDQAMKIIDDIRAKHSILLRKVDFHLVFHDNQTIHTTASHLPHNYLRNIALQNAGTEYVMVLDADVVPSTGSHDMLLNHFKTTKQLRDDELAVLVLPAFARKLPGIHEPATHSMMTDDLPPTKSDLLQRMKDFPGRMDPFHRYSMYSNQTRWYNASEPYPADGYLDYEPYFVVRKSAALPPFWEPFTGYGTEMLSWAEEMAVAGFKFYVSPDSFVYQIGHDKNNHDANAIRPYIADEYASEFQAYLRNVYGKSLWSHSAMALWNENQKFLYVEKTFRICTKDFVPLLGGNHSLHLGYQCEGNHYLDFGREMRSLAIQLPEPVGRRAFPVASNMTVLVMGNSHTRQMMLSLLCQFKEEVIEYDNVMGFNTSRGDSFRVRFRNNSTIMSLTNNPVVYSPHWVTLVENIVGRPLGSFDAIVLGKFNSFNESKGTSFTETVTQALRNLPGAVDFSKSQAPTLPDVMAIYDGPVVYFSMFAAYGQSQFRDNDAVMKNASGTRDNISVINGRKYVDILKLECGSDGFNMVGTCKEGEEGKNAHRCTGVKGGHPDLMAWEVAEVLNKL